jgi:hypothetical protein
MGRKLVAVIVVVTALIVLSLLAVAVSDTSCPSLFFCSPEPTTIFIALLLVTVVFVASLAANLAGRGPKPEPPPDD